MDAAEARDPRLVATIRSLLQDREVLLRTIRGRVA